jgi:hypothetical protein
MPKKLFTITSKDFIQADEWLAKTFGEEKVQESIYLSYKGNMIPELMQLYGDYVYSTILEKVVSDFNYAKSLMQRAFINEIIKTENMNLSLSFVYEGLTQTEIASITNSITSKQNQQ